jgi:hypothetical protein
MSRIRYIAAYAFDVACDHFARKHAGGKVAVAAL